MKLLSALLLAFAASLSGAANAQTYPDHPVRIVVPNPAGGPNDIIARILAQKLSEIWGQQAVIDNRGGAGGNLGAEIVAKAPPDGYTLLLTTPGPLAINQFLYRQLAYNPTKDFEPLALIATVQMALMVNPSVPAKNVRELIELAKAQPGKVSFGSSGNGSTNHLAGQLFKSLAHIDIQHVPYRGAAPAMNDLVGGQIQMMFDNLPGVLPQAKGGRVRVLAVGGAQRASALPDVPTVAESGVQGFEASSWFALVAPTGIPPAIAKKIIDDVRKVLAMPDVRRRFEEAGAEPGKLFGPEFAKFERAEADKWSKVVKASGAQIE